TLRLCCLITCSGVPFHWLPPRLGTRQLSTVEVAGLRIKAKVVDQPANVSNGRGGPRFPTHRRDAAASSRLHPQYSAPELRPFETARTEASDAPVEARGRAAAPRHE